MGDMCLKHAGEPCSTFLRIVDLVDGTAEHIEDAIRAYVADKGLALSKLIRRSNPYIVAINCVAHRLALPCSQAGGNISYVQ